MNLVERFFRDITVDCIGDGSFSSVQEHIDSIPCSFDQRNLNPVAYQWHAEDSRILEKMYSIEG